MSICCWSSDHRQAGRFYDRGRLVTMTDEKRYGVIRPAADLPPGALPAKWDGLWIELGPTTVGIRAEEWEGTFADHGTATATDRFETREDGAVARVFEVRPGDVRGDSQ